MSAFSLIFSLTMTFAHAAIPSRASYFEVAWSRLPSYISFCLSDSQCKIDEDQKVLLMKILKNYDQEEKNLIFTNDRKNPNLFTKVGAHRIAVTGSNVGNPIYINEDELGHIDYGSAIAILVHELGHHHGISDTENRALDILGVKVKQYILNRAEWADLSEYNQPQVALMILNSPDPKWQDKNDSEILFFKGDIVKRFDSDISRPLPCPLGLKRKGGLVLTQPRLTGLTDWRPPLDQGFIFELNLKQICENPQETYIQWIQVQVATAFEFPLGTPQKEDWWKNQEAIVSQKDEILISTLGTSNQWADDRPSLPLEVKDLKLPQKALADGDVLSLKAQVRTPLNKPIEACKVHISSRDLIMTLNKPRHRIELTSCTLRRVRESVYDLEAHYKIPSPTPSRNYYIQSIQVHTAQEQIRFVADMGVGSIISVKSNHLPRDLKIIGGNIIEKTNDGSVKILEPDLKWESGNTQTVSLMNAIFGVTFYFESESPVLKSSHFVGNYTWLKDQQENRVDIFESQVGNSLGNWNFPWAGSTVLQSSPSNSKQWAFQLALRPYTVTRPRQDLHVLQQLDFKYIWLINENLQELYQILDYRIQTR